VKEVKPPLPDREKRESRPAPLFKNNYVDVFVLKIV
jgi:hypothetical protein